jgi:exodeoxyribonuclease-5
MTEWAAQQQVALDRMRRWYDAPGSGQVFFLAGYAGTGKTTLAREMWEHVGGGALCAAFTGKAASVMARKGLLGATTVHRLIYNPAGEEDEETIQELRDELYTLEGLTSPGRIATMRMEAIRRQLQEFGARGRRPRFVLKGESDVQRAPLVILDEASMVDERMGEDLLSFGTKVLVLGDPAQLPPIRNAGYFTERQPDYLLTDVHRQAADSPIIHLATAAREGRALPRGDWGAARVVGGVAAADALAADQILVGTNAKRRACNARHRSLKGHEGPWPKAGERLVCLRNDHSLGLLNGTQWVADEDAAPDTYDGDALDLAVRPDEDGATLGALRIAAERRLFLDDSEKSPFGGGLQQFTYGYALTVHKAQGSQWGSVLLFSDWPSNRGYKEWLYTGITRAADKLTVVL